MHRFLALVFMIWASNSIAETVRLAVTTSFENSGLSHFLIPKIKSETGIALQILVVGTGQALKLGQAGDVDAVLVHSRKDEEVWVESGHGPYRRELMYNDYVLIGPKTQLLRTSGSMYSIPALNGTTGLAFYLYFSKMMNEGNERTVNRGVTRRVRGALSVERIFVISTTRALHS